MIFVRIAVSITTGRVVGAMAQDYPFPCGSVGLAGEECAMVDLGAVDDQDWTDAKGARCSVSRHFQDRAEKLLGRDIMEKRASAELHVEGLHGLAAALEVPAIMDVPCTMAGLEEHLRARGPAALPLKLRAWLANILPGDDVARMGLGRGLPISAMKAAEALRNRRDPAGGSRMLVLEREAQQQADRMAAARLRARQKKGG